MAYVNYVKECITFMEFASDERLSASEQSLWHTLFHLMNQRANGSDWPEGFISIPNARVLLYMNVKEDTLIDARNKLKQRGLIDYIRGDRNKRAPQYRMHYFPAELSTGYTQNGESYPEKSGNDRGNDSGNDRGNAGGNAGGCAPNLNVNYNRNPNRIPNACEDEDVKLLLIKAATKAYREHFGKEPTVAEINQMASSARNRGMNTEVMTEAIRQAAMAHANYPAMYVLQLLRDWHAEFVFSIDDLTEYQALKDACEGKDPFIRPEKAMEMAQSALDERISRSRLRVIGE